MDPGTSNIKSVLEALLKTNRPPTDHEKAIIQDSIAPTNAKLKAVEAQISVTMAHIQALKEQVEQAEAKLQRLRETEAAILETSQDHRRVLSVVRSLPEDVLREICVACVEIDMPTLSYRRTPLPYRLAQISSGMRRVALTTPSIWSSMHVHIDPHNKYYRKLDERAYSILARKTHEWFERAGQLALIVFINDPTIRISHAVSHPSAIFFDMLLSYSTRWKEVRFHSNNDFYSATIWHIAKLTVVDVPLLQSVSLNLGSINSSPMFHNSALLTIPTIKQVTLEADHVQFTVNCTFLTSVTLHGYCHSRRSIAQILQQHKRLVFCDIVVGPAISEVLFADRICLPFLKTFIYSERIFAQTLYAAPSLLDIFTAPNLEVFHIRETFLNPSLADFFKNSPHIRKLSLPYLNKGKSLTDTMGLLRHCPSLTDLFLRPCEWGMYNNPPLNRDANAFLRAFVEEGNIGVTCPRLQYFSFTGKIQFSLETLRLFLEGKQGEIAMVNSLLPWKRVGIDITGIEDKDMRQQMSDLVSQKKAAGLDIEIIVG